MDQVLTRMEFFRVELVFPGILGCPNGMHRNSSGFNQNPKPNFGASVIQTVEKLLSKLRWIHCCYPNPFTMTATIRLL